ncbi:hypothetical protein HYPBUDRAFT_6755 [Hyphopichia burtonii NRRL Y-1933]|uniref:Uncharacterized protein n=1 Tax=Hyphopichia burtonii NRRL Y-1933 TaxID=984485 RepID=A0A1E4RGE7_9ASCO|nr:hypothetical protein HYPBUDRAFT_6755 [Hyphopichia burtonii NRRL Y-1933]ODV66344.1 hypothetical protein HYPBUDRAFT_6755 [Hyphopichia burtonii NRRL Y-1933]
MQFKYLTFIFTLILCISAHFQRYTTKQLTEVEELPDNLGHFSCIAITAGTYNCKILLSGNDDGVPVEKQHENGATTIIKFNKREEAEEFIKEHEKRFTTPGFEKREFATLLNVQPKNSHDYQADKRSNFTNIEKRSATDEGDLGKRFNLTGFEKRFNLTGFEKRSNLTGFEKRSNLTGFEKRFNLTSLGKREINNDKRFNLTGLDKKFNFTGFGKRDLQNDKRFNLTGIEKRLNLTGLGKRAVIDKTLNLTDFNKRFGPFLNSTEV